MKLSKTTVAKEIFDEIENKSYKPEASMLKPSEVKTQETQPEEKPAAKPEKRTELAPVLLGWS